MGGQEKKKESGDDILIETVKGEHAIAWERSLKHADGDQVPENNKKKKSLF